MGHLTSNEMMAHALCLRILFNFLVCCPFNYRHTGDITYKTYLVPNKVSLIFEKVSETNVMQIINNLPNKNSCGFDGISTIVMKSIKHVILNHLLY